MGEEKSEGLVDRNDVIRTRHSFSLLTLGLLTSVCSIVDRSVLSILAEPIKREMNLSDTQLGLLTGFAFALFYATIGLPIARYVDRPSTHRPKVVAACLGLWSAMTMISGAATGFLSLMFARILVGVGESGSGPALFTLINDTVPAKVRSRAFGIYGLGPSIGTLLGLVVAGLLVDRIGWRLTFVVVGAPGLVLGLAVLLFMHEPRRALSQTQDKAPVISLRSAIQSICDSPAMMWLIGGSSTGAVLSLGLPSWTAIFLIRELHLPPSQVGALLGITLGVASGLGTFLGGYLADKLGARKSSYMLIIPVIGLTAAAPVGMFAFAATDWITFAVLFSFVALAGALWLAPLIALTQQLVPPGSRATASVIVFLMINLVGAGLGPLLIGVASDLLSSSSGADGLRTSLILIWFWSIVPAVLFWRAGRCLDHEIDIISTSSDPLVSSLAK